MSGVATTGFLASRIVSALLLALAFAMPALADVDLRTLAVSPNPRLGLAFPGSMTRYYPLIAQAGIGTVRISASWARIEPRRGQFDFGGLDDRIRALQDLGIAPFVTFESTADWATDPATRGVKNARPRDPADWSRFVRAVVDRYDGDGSADMPGLSAPVTYYQAANEWISDTNRSGGWASGTADLIDYVRVAHDAVKGQDPRATFVMGGIAAFNSDILLVARDGRDLPVRQSWSPTSETVLTRSDMRGPTIASIIDDRVLPVLREAPFDVASVHLYGPEDRDGARIAWLKRITGRPVLSSECGGPTLDYGGSYSGEEHFRAVVERNLNVLATGAPFCLWFRLGESEGASYGNRRTALYLATADAKPGVYAYRLLARLIDAAARVEVVGPGRFESGVAAASASRSDGVRPRPTCGMRPSGYASQMPATGASPPIPAPAPTMP